MVMTLELSRKDVCSLMIGCTLIHKILSDDDPEWIVRHVVDDDPEWIMLHDKLKRQLEEYDHQRLREGDHSVR